MRTVSRFGLVLAVAATAGLALACQPAAPPETESAPAPPSDEEQIRAMMETFEGAWAQADAAAVAAGFTDDGDILTSAGFPLGRAAVEEFYSQSFAGPFKGTTIDVEMTSVRFLTPDVALTDGTYEISGFKGPDGEDLGSVRGQFTGVNVKADDGWRIGCSRPMIPVATPEA